MKFSCKTLVLEFVLVSFTLVQSFLVWGVFWVFFFYHFGMGITALHVFFTYQPYVKRARHECSLEEEYRSALQAATGALEAIELLLQKSPPPDWLLVKMETLQERIDKLKCHVF